MYLHFMNAWQLESFKKNHGPLLPPPPPTGLLNSRAYNKFSFKHAVVEHVIGKSPVPTNSAPLMKGSPGVTRSDQVLTRC